MSIDDLTIVQKPETHGDSRWIHWALRLSIAGTFIFHGLAKFGDLGGGAERFGVPLGIWVVASVLEVLAPIALIAGGLIATKFGDLLTRIAAAVGAGFLIGAIGLEHWGQWSFAPSDTHPLGGMEFQVALLTMHLYFLLRGNNA